VSERKPLETSPREPLSTRTGDALQDDSSMFEKLEVFLDDLAEGHRDAMNEVVSWLWKGGNLEGEIHRSVAALSGLFQKWSFEIMFLLRMRGTMRFNQLKEELSSVHQKGLKGRVANLTGIGSRTLSARLKDLEEAGLVKRKVFAEVPPRVEYSVTERGEMFGDLIMPVIAYLRIQDISGRKSKKS
jgi:DNA-binding HxlR family transcriptional regulator